MRFHELWSASAKAPADKPDAKTPVGLPAEEALRRAQAFVRSHEKWRHPHSWAGWALWGLPE